MIRIDDSLLEELGLLSLPKEERDTLLRQIYETLEMRVGMRLAERMSDAQLDEFERFINGDLAFTEDYLNQKKAGWATSEAYQKAMQNAQTAAQRAGRQVNENAVKTEYGALTWLETNFPDYKDVVAQELEKLKGEIKADSGKIVEAMGSGGVNQGASPQQGPAPYQPPTQPMQPAPSQPQFTPPPQPGNFTPPQTPQYPPQQDSTQITPVDDNQSSPPPPQYPQTPAAA